MSLAIVTQYDLDEQVRLLQAMIDEDGLTAEASLVAAEIKEAGFRVELRESKVWVGPHAPLPEGEERRAERPTGFEFEESDE